MIFCLRALYWLNFLISLPDWFLMDNFIEFLSNLGSNLNVCSMLEGYSLMPLLMVLWIDVFIIFFGVELPLVNLILFGVIDASWLTMVNWTLFSSSMSSRIYFLAMLERESWLNCFKGFRFFKKGDTAWGLNGDGLFLLMASTDVSPGFKPPLNSVFLNLTYDYSGCSFIGDSQLYKFSVFWSSLIVWVYEFL